MKFLTRTFSGPITGRRFFTWMVAFFAVISAVNATFIFLALDTWPGLTTSRAYDEGLSYNKVLADASAQNALGWKSRAHLGGATPKGRVLLVDIKGPEGPVSGLKVFAELFRPVGEGTRISLALTPDGAGQYMALVRLPVLGRWRLDLTATRGQESAYRMTHELQTAGGVK
ncbi:MAG: FixH family protein [Rhodospirillales bacterium]